MTLLPCSPCGCIPGNISNEKFKQDVEILLCNNVGSLSIPSIPFYHKTSTTNPEQVIAPPGAGFRLVILSAYTAVYNGAGSTDGIFWESGTDVLQEIVTNINNSIPQEFPKGLWLGENKALNVKVDVSLVFVVSGTYVIASV